MSSQVESPVAEPQGLSNSANAQRQRITGLWAVFALLILSAVIYLGNAPFPALLDDADAAHAMVSYEMLQRHDWVILYMNGIRYLMKAPLHYWAVAASYAVLGKNEFSTRLPVALAMIALSLLVYEFARRYFGARAALYSGLAVSTSAGFFLFTRIMIPEALYALEFTAVFYLFFRGWTHSLEPRKAYWGAAAFTALAMLTRGLVGVIFPVAVIFLFLTATRSWGRWRELRPFSSTLIFLIIAAPWHILASLRANTFFWSYFINEHFKRAVGTRYPPDYEAVPLWLWLSAHLVWLFPWSIFLPCLVGLIPRPQIWGKLSDRQQATLLFTIWATFILLFFSLTFGSRMEYYSFGAWPAIAMLLGIGLATAEERNLDWLRWMQGALALLGAVIAAVLLAMLWISRNVQARGDIYSALNEHETDFYRVSMAHMLDLTPQAFAYLRLPSALAAAAFLAGLGAAWWLRRNARHLASSISLGVTMAVFFFAANIAYGVFSPYLSSRPLLRNVASDIRPNDTLALYGEFDTLSTISFYTHRRLLLWNGRYNNLEAGSYYPDAPHIFFTDPEFLAQWRGPQRIFLFVPSEHRADATKRLPTSGTYLLAQNGGKAVYVNHPPLFSGMPAP